MDPSVIAAIFALVSSVLIAAFSMRSGKGQLANSASDSFRDDLLQRLQQLEAKVERQDARIERLTDENSRLRTHVFVVTEWAKYSDQPIPRTPPPFNPVVTS